jgi:hypothetical protein
MGHNSHRNGLLLASTPHQSAFEKGAAESVAIGAPTVASMHPPAEAQGS